MAAEAKVKEAFEAYMQAFMHEDYQAIADMVSVPAVLCQSADTIEITSAEMVVKLMQQLRASLPSNYATTDIIKSDVTMLNASLAALHGVYERHTASGGLISRDQGLYLFALDEAGWKMCCITVMADLPT